MKCPKCQFENLKDVKFCNECGSKLEIFCPECGNMNPSGSNFCNECGYNLKYFKETFPVDYEQPQSYTPKHLADKILTSRSSIEGERKLVTVLFADVANYTSMSEKLDPEDVHQIMDGCFKILMDEIHKYEGTINQFTGDGVMALFGAPVAHEDHAKRACHAALSIQKALNSYKEELRRKYGMEFKMRIGLNSGPVIVGSIGDDLRMDYTAVGDTTNLAARIQQTAKPEEVRISQETRNFSHSFFIDEPLGKLSLKGKIKPQSIYRLVSERKGVRSRFEAGLIKGVAELVGRRKEMKILLSLTEKVRSNDAQIIDVLGEAGVGKSRLVYEFKRALNDDLIFLTGICLQYGGNINFLPMMEIVREAFEIEEGMNEKEVGHQIELKAQDKLESMIPFYRNLLSLKVEDPEFNKLPPDARKFGMFEAVKDLVLSESQEKMVIIFLEDIHWMDKISEEFFAYLSRCISDHRVMILSAYRPEVTPSWSKGSRYQKIQLEALSSKPSIQLVHNLLGGLRLDQELARKIVDITGGNPFFIEEIVKDLRDRDEIVMDRDQYICNIPINQLHIPDTVQAVLAARMDRLDQELKRTMQVASVIGRDFAFRILKKITEFGDALRNQLNKLVGLEILYEKSFFPELEYIFKHALTQEVAYDSLLKKKRKEIHENIAKAIEILYADRIEEYYELLVHHYEKSGNARKTITYLVLAGEKSKKNKAAYAACEFYKKVFEVANMANISLDPEIKVRVHQGLASSSHDIGDIYTAMEEYKKSIDICRQKGLEDHEMNNLAELAWTLWFTPIKSMKTEVIDFHKKSLARARSVKNKAIESRILAVQGFYQSVLGFRYEGNRMITDAERIALKTGNQQAISFTRFQRATSERWLGRPEKTIELTEGLVEALRSAFNLSDTFFTISFIRGLALAEYGRIEDSLAILREGIDICEKYGGGLHLGRLYNGLGFCYQEIYQPNLAWEFNMRSKEVALQLMEKYPMNRSTTGEIVAQANVNLMENMFDQGNYDGAWNQIKSFQRESRKEDYDRARDRWKVRMDHLTAQILLQRGEIGPARNLIQKNLEITQREHSRKMEGSFLRLFGEVLIKQGECENAVNYIDKAIHILQEVGNPRKLWEAYNSKASAMEKSRRPTDAQTQWASAVDVIQGTANKISDSNFRGRFLDADPIKKILSKMKY